MRVNVNGRTTDIQSGDLAGLLSELDYEVSFLAIALNEEVVPRRRWAETLLKNGDRIEIITPRQGG